ncbi:MAG: IS66 family transposase [Dehalococcoidia bacterium]
MSKNQKNHPADIEHIDISISDLEAIIERSKAEPLSDHDCERLRSVVKTLLFLTQELEKKGTSIQRLRMLLFGATTEKLQNILDKALGSGKQQENESGCSDDSQGNGNEKAKGHGRNGAQDYVGAETVHVAHKSLKAGDDCPECRKGSIYETAEPGVIVRITGQAPLKAMVYKLQKFRCNLCGTIFTAEPPKDVGNDKYDAQSASMIALLKYGSGVPFNRLESLQGSLGIPLPAATQWEIVEDSAGRIETVFEEMIHQAAQGQVLHNDDTTMKILSFCNRHDDPIGPGPPAPERTGVFTSGIVSVLDGRRIALFFTGHRHAGENLAAVLKQRASELGRPIQMCDALSRNIPKELETIVANCLAHGRRRFVEVAPNFPDECLHVLEFLKDVYKNDAQAKRQEMSAQQRLHWHQAQSGQKMADLESWLTEQIEQRKVEPNSGLGEAIAYMLKHWNKLTLFLRQPGAPLDNNVCERALKRAILHRKNAYFYKTQNGARVGDLFMSLIHTCELNDVNPFYYLTQLQKHAEAVALCPADWMPWNYKQTLTRSP